MGYFVNVKNKFLNVCQIGYLWAGHFYYRENRIKALRSEILPIM